MVKVGRKIGALVVGTAMLFTTLIPTTTFAANNISVDINIDTSANRTAISPLIYGGNWDFNNATLTARRLGGNRMTGYNWENNFSNAGSDWQHSSDTFLLTDGKIPADKWTEPGVVITSFHDKNLTKSEQGKAYSLVTLQAAGYVAADDNGTVAEKDVAPSSRWAEVKFKKDAPYALTPDTTDGSVYMDELVNFLVDKYGNALTSNGIKAYALDNEPALWSGTHPRIHPNNVTCAEIVDKNVNLAKSVKSIDPFAEVYGLIAYGFAEYNTMQDATDWKALQAANNYGWFLDYYLDSMKKAEEAEGKRLVDVLDLHWYPEAQGGGERICFTKDSSNLECNKARLQAPRTLWDRTYDETSWINTWFKGKLPLLKTVNESINQYYPGTKLAFTEYSYGGDDHITGGIAQADVLGVFGKNGVYMASVWGSGSYTAAGFNLYTNYDGKGSKFGDTSVKAETSDAENNSVYASVDSEDDSKLHIVVMNKNYDSPTTVKFNLAGGKTYKSGKVFAFDRGSSNIYERDSINNITGNQFSYTIPALTACHIVLDTNGTSINYMDVNNDGVIDAIDYALFKKFLMNPDHGYDAKLDLNADKSVDAIDFALAKQVVLGVITSLPVVSVAANRDPKAAFTLSPKEAFTGDDVAFDASASTDPDGNLYVYSWSFGDGTEASGVKVNHKYKAAGTYTPKLTVTDKLGLSNSITDTVVITNATGDNSDLNFEDGELAGATSNSTASDLSVTNEKAFLGTKSLKWTVTPTVDGKADVVVNSSKPVLTPGTSMTFRVWIPSGAAIKTIQPYVMPHDASWGTVEWNSAWASYETIKKDAWNEFTVTLSASASTTLVEQQFGIQVETSGTEPFTMYVDSINW